MLLTHISCVVYLIVNHFVLVQSEIVRYWGEPCVESEQCTDHRLTCGFTPGMFHKRCICDSFHEWNSTHRACIPRYNMTVMLAFLSERHNTTYPIEQEAKIVFFGAMLAGLIVTCVGIICFTSVVIFCLHVRKTDKMEKHLIKTLKEDLKKNEVLTAKPKKDTLLV